MTNIKEVEKEIDKDALQQVEVLLSPPLARLLYHTALKANGGYLEPSLYAEVLNGLSNELQEQGMKITFSTKLLLEQVAMTVIRIQRARLMETNSNLQVVGVADTKLTSNYEEKVYPSLHPITGYIERLEKKLIYLLKQLGLLPEQQVERQKVMLVEKMKQRVLSLENNCGSYKLDLVAETKKSI